MTSNFTSFIDTIRRWRTWIVNSIGALLIILPELLNAPEVLAVVPVGYQKWVFVVALALNVWMRPRPAALANDPEVQINNAISATPGPTTVTVKATGGNTTAVIHA